MKMQHQPLPVDVKTINRFSANDVARLVTECQEIIEDGLKEVLSTVPDAVLAGQLWSGRISPCHIQQELIGPGRLQSFVAGLSAELSSLAAGIFQRLVLLQVCLPDGQAVSGGMAKILNEQLTWSREKHILSKALVEACDLVWDPAVPNYAWPARWLKPGRQLWYLAGATSVEEEQRCLQELTMSMEGVRVNMQKRLCREVSLQIAAQIWSLFDSISEKISGAFMNPESDYCA